MEQAIDIKRHSLVQLCAMLALVLSKILTKLEADVGYSTLKVGNWGSKTDAVLTLPPSPLHHSPLPAPPPASLFL